MACFHPITAFQHIAGGPLCFHEKKDHKQIQIACGQCHGCRLEKSRQWAVRCMNEAQMHHHNCFITLTYSREHLPENNNLRLIDAQKFLRRLRKALGRKSRLTTILRDTPTTTYSEAINRSKRVRPLVGKVRFYLAGEYGEQYGRPHFHICLFGIDFADKQYISKSPAGHKLYTSATLEELWPYGFSSIGALTFESAAYTARYIMKKVNGQKQNQHYTRLNLETGEIYKQKPEFNNMSRKPGIGKTWIEKYETDVYPEGKIIVRGKKANAPRYYDKIYKTKDPLGWETTEWIRHQESIAHAADATELRLRDREIVAEAKTKLLKRKL